MQTNQETKENFLKSDNCFEMRNDRIILLDTGNFKNEKLLNMNLEPELIVEKIKQFIEEKSKNSDSNQNIPFNSSQTKQFDPEEDISILAKEEYSKESHTHKGSKWTPEEVRLFIIKYRIIYLKN